MSVHLESVNLKYRVEMEIYSKIAPTDITVMTNVSDFNKLEKILKGTVGFKNKNELNKFNQQGMKYFSFRNGKIQIRFVGDYNLTDIKRFVNAINAYSQNSNNQKTKHNSQTDKEFKRLKEKQRKLEEKRMLEKTKNHIREEISSEKNKIKNMDNSNNYLINKKERKINDLKKEILKVKSSNKKISSYKTRQLEEEVLEEKLKLMEKQLNEKQETQIEVNDEQLIIIEDYSDNLVISSNLKNESLINQITSENYLGYSSMKELEEFQDKANIKLIKNDKGSYDFVFRGKYSEDEAQRYVDNITEEYGLTLQEITYEKLSKKIRENNLDVESEQIDKDDSIILTINI